MDILIPDLHEHRARVGKQVASNLETVSEVREVGVDAFAPSVAERFHLLRLTRYVLRPAVAHVTACRGPLEVNGVNSF